MICISERFSGNIPCSIPAEIFLVNEDPHQFCYGNCRVCIIELYCDLIGKFPEIRVCFLEASYDVLNCCGDKEVFLFQAEFLSFEDIVIGVKHFCDILGNGFGGYCLDVVPVIKIIKIEFARGFCGP